MSAHLQAVAFLDLVPSTPYALAYALPLLLLSCLLTFAGAFLTLDRTRSFAPHYNALPGAFDTSRKKKFHWLLEGGVGGLAIGYTFGVYFSTFLALLIPNASTEAPLSPKSFMPVWLLSAAVTTFLAGRWKYCALVLAGISGGTAISLSLSIITHPALLTRVVLTSIIMPITTIVTVLPFARTQHIALRTATSATGAFGLVLSIAILSRIPGWANVWERLWLSDHISWGASKERGLSATWCIFVCIGAACDWFLNQQFGENPDQKWDHYLANYAANLPNAADRAGTFQPLSYSFWNRLFGKRQSPTSSESVRFPTDEMMKAQPKSHSLLLKDVSLHTSSDGYKFQRTPEFLKKGKSHSQARLKVYAKSGRRREGVKFRPLDELDTSDTSPSEDEVPLTPDSLRPWLKNRPSLKSVATGSDTLNENEEVTRMVESPVDKLEKVKAGLGKNAREGGEGIPEYSDYEEDVTAHMKRAQRRASRGKPGWSPEFLERHRNGNTPPGSEGTSPSHRSAGVVPVPATPSLIKAMDRIAVAQQEAFSARSELPPSKPSDERADGLPTVNTEAKAESKAKGGRWEAFWREVKDKAQER